MLKATKLVLSHSSGHTHLEWLRNSVWSTENYKMTSISLLQVMVRRIVQVFFHHSKLFHVCLRLRSTLLVLHIAKDACLEWHLIVLLVAVLEAVETECGRFGSVKKCIVGQEGDSPGKVHHLLQPHLFPVLCRIDVSDQLPPHNPVLCLLSRESLRFTLSVHFCFGLPFLHMHPHHSFPHIFFIPSHDISVPL